LKKSIEDKLKAISDYKKKLEANERRKKTTERQISGGKKLIDKQKQEESLRKNIEANREAIEKLNKVILGNAFSKHFPEASRFILTSEGYTMKDIYETHPVYSTEKTEFTKEDLEDFKVKSERMLSSKQSPFLTIADSVRKRDTNGNEYYDWEELFKWYKRNRRFARLTIVSDVYEYETLAKNFKDIARKELKDGKFKDFWENLPDWRKNLPWNKARYAKRVQFNSIDEVIKYNEELSKGIHKEIMINGKSYSKLGDGINFKGSLSPSLKEIDIRSADDFRIIYDFITKDNDFVNNDLEYRIGFTTLNDFMDAMNNTYNYFSSGKGVVARIISQWQSIQKLAMRLSTGFLFRNLMDTWNQLYSHTYMEIGPYGYLKDPLEVFRFTLITGDIYNIYSDLSTNRFAMLLDMNQRYKYITETYEKVEKQKRDFTDEEISNIMKNLLHIKAKLEGYVKGSNAIDASEITNRIVKRTERAEKTLNNLKVLINNMSKDLYNTTDLEVIEKYLIDNKYVYNNKFAMQQLKGRKELDDSLSFLMNIRFAEYFLMYSDLEFTGDHPHKKRLQKVILNYQNHYKDNKKLRGSKLTYADLKEILFEISAFMQTNAQLDTYRQEHFEYLRKVTEAKRLDDEQSAHDLTIEQVTKLVELQAVNIFKDDVKNLDDPFLLLRKTMKKGLNLYNALNGWIETTARIGGYLCDRQMFGYTFDETVNRSLKRWFNYGQRSPLEMQLLADIPYLSFPLRSIDNWIDRLLDPRYMRLLSDVIDGFYGQYRDEDGQYGEYAQFMIMNGWVPITKNFGLRFGNGAFDIKMILENPGETMIERRNPLLRGVQTLINTGDIKESMKALALVGVVTRASNTLVPREVAQSTPIMKDFVSKKPRTIGTTANMFFDTRDVKKGYGYKKYTPKQYLNNNGRYAHYENVYKDWFNKYGRMRKPTVDPYSLVKNIQWRNYVKQRQTKNMLR
jgi:hypothetical protein